MSRGLKHWWLATPDALLSTARSEGPGAANWMVSQRPLVGKEAFGWLKKPNARGAQTGPAGEKGGAKHRGLLGGEREGKPRTNWLDHARPPGCSHD